MTGYSKVSSRDKPPYLVIGVVCNIRHDLTNRNCGSGSRFSEHPRPILRMMESNALL